ncbi:MAG: NfeD family protein [Oscillospiraceae bacterium]|nr:NfeD family protein [Oscillospiraceae bacterium]
MLYVFVWLFAVIALSIVEAATCQLISIWFAIGGVAAFIAAVTGAGFYVQAGVFAIVSVICLLLTRPLAKKILNNKIISTNSDSLIGKTFQVFQTIDNRSRTGQIKINDVIWNARSDDESIINEGCDVCVEKIEGTKLIVKRC